MNQNQQDTTTLRLASAEETRGMTETKGTTTAAVDEATILFDAVRGGDLASVESLLGAGSDVNATDAEGWTALMWATVKGYTKIARTLLEFGADVHAKNSKGWTALRFAISLNDVELACPLLEYGADVNDQDSHGTTSLMQAAGEKSLESLRLLLDYGADTEARNLAGETALRVAARHGYDEIVQCLIEAGATNDEGDPIKIDSGLFSEGELERLIEELDGMFPASASAYNPVPPEMQGRLHEVAREADDLQPERSTEEASTEVRAVAPVAVRSNALERLAAALESLRCADAAAPAPPSIADLAHKLLLSLPEAAALSGLSRRHVREAVRAGELKARKIGQGWRLKRSDLEAYVRSL